MYGSGLLVRPTEASIRDLAAEVLGSVSDCAVGAFFTDSSGECRGCTFAVGVHPQDDNWVVHIHRMARRIECEKVTVITSNDIGVQIEASWRVNDLDALGDDPLEERLRLRISREDRAPT